MTRLGLAGDVVVNLFGGEYVLSQPLAFSDAAGDSGSNGFNVIYQANNYGGGGRKTADVPVLSGGVPVTGWQLADPVSNIWSASVGSLDTRQLFVNGVRAERAWVPGLDGVVQQTPTGYITTDLSPQSWRDPKSVEFVWTGKAGKRVGNQWQQDRCPVDSVTGSPAGSVITLVNFCYYNATHELQESVTLPTSIENDQSFLTASGQWSFDRAAHTIFYKPRAGEDMATVSAVVPKLETLLDAGGIAVSPLHNVQFKGLTFAHATWLAPNGTDGFVEQQAGVRWVTNPWPQPFAGTEMPLANISVHHARNVLFERDTFEHLGGSGLGFAAGAKNNQVVGCVFRDISTNGVQVGNLDAAAPPDEQAVGNVVSNNYVHDVGIEYLGSVGILGLYQAETVISHNEVAHVPYSGISVGWGWGGTTATPYTSHITIAANRVHDVMLSTVGDGSAIYLNGTTVGARSTVTGNWAYADPQSANPALLWGDNGASQWDITGNVAQTEGIGWWLEFQPVAPPATNNTATGNYTDTANMSPAGTNTVADNTVVPVGAWPAAAQAIMTAAGVEAAYADILL